ncbi:DEAD/DEAH box helicase family protein [Rhizorhabdus dicambivorans]|uniref:Helicase n=1 Tax=Rhizorhabdus dicambivorans TaxID=1850238 RepID=A0A2A4FSU1_9SPHN|nr:DEAD/DEAH box helicase family protein [Rhizorhabdus dicambivorans]ATE66800.1 helicase [Rhizorhabdus dicambivorans]PCE40790.1 helicase [Rhizorhabdus dicambivorans]
MTKQSAGPGEAPLSLKAHYRSGRDDLAQDFFAPCLRKAVRYRRAVGYFSTSALLSWADALLRFAHDGALTAQLIASPELSSADAATLRSLQDPERIAAYQAMIVDRVLGEIVALLDSPDDRRLRANVFAWLVANERVQLKFAFPEHVEDAGIFHEKIGVFDFPGGAQAAFTGSANETISGHRNNYESVDVYRSWAPGELERVKVKVEQFEEAWANLAPGLKVLSPSTAVLDRIRERAPRGTAPTPEPEPAPAVSDPRWAHQDEAVAAFLEARAGVLEMATGTGKTRTALKILSTLVARDAINTAIVTMEGTDLLDQWADELQDWNATGAGPGWLIYRQYERHHESGEYALDPARAIMVISRGQLRPLLDRLAPAVKARAIIVHDEVHGLGTPSLVEALKGRHAGFAYRVGLSATPERAYDAQGNTFVTEELGPVLYQFPLEMAISRGVLCEFDYLPLPYDLTPGDRERLQAIYARKAGREREGRPMSREELWTEIAKVYKTAEMKPQVFADFLPSRPEVLKRSILFVETREYGAPILELLHKYTHLYRTYYADDDRDHLVAFARGEIDCLVTCHRISQGIDIRSLNTVILFASARARLETIQRIGRCLRFDPLRPDKRALVIDFVRPASAGDPVPNADQARAQWLSELATVRKGDSHGA